MIDETTQGLIKRIDGDLIASDIHFLVTLIDSNASRLPPQIYGAGTDIEYALTTLRDALDEYLESDDE